MIKKYIVVLILGVFVESVYAQKGADSISHKTIFSVSLEPLFYTINATRLNIELKPEGKRYQFIITPEFYSGKIQDVNMFQNQIGVNRDKISGFGIGLMKKFKREPREEGLYSAYGAIYRKQVIKFDTEAFRRYEKEGLTYYDYGPVSDKLNIQSVMINGVVGYQTFINRLLIDVYVGLGYKKPFVKSNYPDAREYRQTPYLYTYSGVTGIAGVKVGLKLN